MSSVLVPASEIGIVNEKAGLKSFRDSLKAQVHQWIAQWQSSSVSMVVYSLIIAMVAIYDISLTIKYANSLAQLEANPIGRWLMNIEHAEIQLLAVPSGMYLFLQLKALGTVVVIAILHGLVRWRLDMGHAVAFGVTAFQVWLFCYLTLR